jgi:hypothetical protein
MCTLELAMADPATDDRLPRIAPLLLVGILAYLAIARPGKLEVESGTAYLLTTLTAMAVTAYVGWRFHGLLPAAAAVCLLWVTDQPAAIDPALPHRAAEATFLATLGLGIAACSRQGRPGAIPWIVLTALAIGVAALGWYRLDMAPTGDPVSHDRVRHLMLGLAAVAVLVGFTARGATWRDRAKLVGVALGPPVAAAVAVRLVHGDWPRLLEGGDWGAVIDEWKGAFAAGDWHAGGWRWTATWVAVPLVLLGVYRTVARGRRQARRGEAPLAWLVTVAAVGAILALSNRPGNSGSLALITVGVMLSVFGVADATLAVVERFQLEPPAPGPSNVPRVR